MPSPYLCIESMHRCWPSHYPSAMGEVVRQHLFDVHRIEMPVTHHAGRQFARVSVQAYNTKAELDLLLQVLPQVLSELGSA